MIEKSVLEKLYCEKKFSAAEIAEELKVTFPTALYWLKKHQIPIRSQSERTYVKLNPDGDPFQPKARRTLKENELFILGLVIYWAEGSRKVRYNVQVVNMDHRMLQLFVRFLRDIARVQESRLRLDVRVYHGFSKEKARRYWCQALRLNPKQVLVNPHIDRRSKPNRQWSPYGIATVRVSSTKLKAWLDQQLEENIGRLLDHWSYSVFSGRWKRDGMVREAAPTTHTYQ